MFETMLPVPANELLVGAQHGDNPLLGLPEQEIPGEIGGILFDEIGSI
jgi:hypothetical protein